MKIHATEAFLAFARPTAIKYANDKDKILYLCYSDLETNKSQRSRWILAVVNRSDFPGMPTMIVDGFEMLYQVEMTKRLENCVLDFQDRKIVVDDIGNEGK